MAQTTQSRLVGFLGAATACTGVVVGLLLNAHTLGITNEQTDELHPVNCGSALNRQFSSINCDQALSGRMTLSITLIVIGLLAAVVGPLALRTREEAAPAPADDDPPWLFVLAGVAILLGVAALVYTGVVVATN